MKTPLFRIARIALSLSLTLAALPGTAQAGYFDQREDVRTFIADVAARNKLNIDELTAQLAGAVPVPRVIDLIKPPTEPGVRSWKRYRARFLDAPRISAGVKFWQDNKAALDDAQARSGVPAEVIAAIIGVETIYGRNTGNFSTLSALATLAFDYPPRAELFRGELEALFVLAREQGQNVQSYRGSYAGAIGLPQFLPSSVRKYAVDGDQDGVIDLQNSPRDAIYSVANFLAMEGWQRGGEIIRPARLLRPDTDPQALVDAGIKPSLDRAQLSAGGVEGDYPSNPNALMTLVDFVTPGEPTQYYLGMQNFYTITRYNRSAFYAMSVVELANALKLQMATRQEVMSGASKLSAPSHKAAPSKPHKHHK